MNKPDIELPPLPSPLGIVDPEGTEGMVQYTASDLANYAKAYAMDAIKPYQQRIAEMEAGLEAIGAGGVSGQRITGGQQRGEPVAYAVFAENGNIRIWCADPIQAEALRQEYGNRLQSLYTAPQPATPAQEPKDNDLMMSGVLRMPFEMAMASEISRLQFYQRAQQALNDLEALQSQKPKGNQMNTHDKVELPEPDSYLFQHEETGLTQYVDRQQVEWGFEKNNPRWQKISGAFTEKQVIAAIDADRKGRGHRQQPHNPPEPVASLRTRLTGAVVYPCISAEYLSEGQHDLITTTQAEAYAEAVVREAQQWHPIETVPEEGPYLVYGGQLAGEAPDLLENLDVIKVNGRVFGDTNFKKSDVVFDVSDAGYSWILILNPTHWMPLPEPP